MSAIEIVEADPQGVDALALLREAAIEMRAIYPDLTPADAPWPTNPVTPPGGTYLVAFSAGKPVACGALHPIDRKTVEVRRMFVTREARGKGLAWALLAKLETRARELGYTVLMLETGNRQLPAIALYESCGFKCIPPFGEYVNDPTSVCLAKPISGLDSAAVGGGEAQP